MEKNFLNSIPFLGELLTGIAAIFAPLVWLARLASRVKSIEEKMEKDEDVVTAAQCLQNQDKCWLLHEQRFIMNEADVTEMKEMITETRTELNGRCDKIIEHLLDLKK